jgi:lipoprotein-anchoring transpeptidase ErfK/SrfK
MKLWKSVFLLFTYGLLIGAVLIEPQPAMAQSTQSTAEPYPGQALCLPDVYLSQPSDCLVMGPAKTLTDMAKNGEYFPPRPLGASHPSPDLTKSPVMIAKLNGDPLEPVKVFGSLDDAVAGNNPVRTIPAGKGLHYISFVGETLVGGKAYVMLKSGEWMRASPSGFSTFQGLLFSKPPTSAFGWVIDNIHAYASPSFNAAEVGDMIYSQTPVQIYEIVTKDDMEWYRIGMNAWVPYLKARRARVDTTPPQGVTGDRWISVDLYDQIAMVYDNRQLVFATLVSTGGKPFYTQPGLFHIYKKKPLETMSGSFEADHMDYYYLEDVPWTMYFDQERALHGAYWRPWFGVAGTHGCVNFSLGDANWLYQWAKEGDWVQVWDPSGQTPTDPKIYGSGGA